MASSKPAATFPDYIQNVLNELPEALDLSLSSDDEEEREYTEDLIERVHNAFERAVYGDSDAV
jgi:hypothetical protein